jgi:pimeloyl-ACP methyl ester carboxylesterase
LPNALSAANTNLAALRYDTGMPQKPFLAFACAHLTDERLYAAQVAALEADYECTVFAFRGRDSDIAKVREGGIEALIPESPSRWLHPSHVQRVELTNLMSEMARSIGARGQFNQQAAMLARPDSHDDLARVRVPTLVMCGRDDPVTPVRDHEAMAAKIPGARLEVIENCGHLATIEQPESVDRVLIDWRRQTDTHSLAIRAR